MVSVVVPVYNSEDTIAACMESILRQTMADLELLVIDDGSTDATAGIIDGLKDRDERLTIVHQQNRGRTEARAEGVRRARGEWVSFVDSDDTLPPDALEKLCAKASAAVDIVLGNGQTLPDEARPLIPMTDFRHKAVRAEGSIGLPWGSLYRREVLTAWLFDIPRHIIMGEDYLFWLRLVFNTEKPVAVVYDAVYCKGAEHTSNCFKWTARYCEEFNELRRLSIPSDRRPDYEDDMLTDRLENLFAMAIWQPRRSWVSSRFYNDILRDARRLHRPLSLKQRLFLALPSLRLRRLYSWLSQKIN